MPQVKSRIDFWLKLVPLGIIFATSTAVLGQLVVINELMASNKETLADGEGQYDDWIELYNSSSKSVNVGGMFLTDDLSVPTKWRFPTNQPSLTTLPAHGYLIIWADNDQNGSGLHTDFGLSAGGEAVGLARTDGTLLDSVVFAEQSVDVSWGRYPNGKDAWQSMASPTPGAANQEGMLGVVDEVRFSVTRGFYDEPIMVTLTTLTEDAQIWFTLDSEVPHFKQTIGRRGTSYNGKVYTEPIPVSTTTCIRAVAIKTGWRDSKSVSHTYLYLDDILKQSQRPAGFPTNWDGASTDYAMDPRIVDDSDYAGELKEDLKAIPSMCIVIPNEDFFGDKGLYSNGQAEGDAWERVASLEWIDPEFGTHFGINTGLRSHGGVGRRAVKHSLRAIFRSEYGASKLKFPLFKDSTVATFDQLIFRAQWNYSWVGDSTACGGIGTDETQYLRETFARDTGLKLGILTPHARHIHLYVNGLYWGLYILSERPDDAFAAETLGGGKEDYDVLKASNSFGSAGMEIKAGDKTAWELLYSFASGDPESQGRSQWLERTDVLEGQ